MYQGRVPLYMMYCLFVWAVTTAGVCVGVGFGVGCFVSRFFGLWCGGFGVVGVCVVESPPGSLLLFPTVVARLRSPCCYGQDEGNPSNGRTIDS